jgi:protein-disulfide isomerase
MMLAALTLLCAGYPPFGLAQPDDNLGILKQSGDSEEGDRGPQGGAEGDRAAASGAHRPAARPSRQVAGKAGEHRAAVDRAPFLGERNAKVTLVEFSDYQCPFCGRHFAQAWPRIVTEYVRTGKVKYVFRNFPIESIHPKAFKAAAAAHCAGDQGKYWEMHDRLFANQAALDPADLTSHAGAVGLDVPAFQRCLDTGKYAGSIRADLADGQEAGVTGTPSFFLGLTEPNASTLTAVSRIVGARPYPVFKEAIEGLLSPTCPGQELHSAESERTYAPPCRR